MADYLATNTPRLRCLYTGPRGTHKMTFRLAPGTTEAAAVAAVHPIVDAMRTFMVSGCNWESAEFAVEGSDVFLPTAWTAIPHPTGAEAATNTLPYGAYINFVGRTTGGSRVAWYLFNTGINSMSANNRLTLAEYPTMSSVFSAFTSAGATLRGIDQTAFIMKNYANSGINDKIARKSRLTV